MEFIVSKKILRDFGLLVGLGIPVFFGYLLPIIFGHEIRNWTIFVGLPILILGIISPKRLKYPYELWMKLGIILGWINSRIILGLIFFMVLLPISLLMRILRYDPLKLKSNTLSSYKEFNKNRNFDLKRIF